MAGHLLDNPFWSALTTDHEAFAIGDALARRYPPDAAPFIAVPAPTEESMRALGELVRPGERVCILAVSPTIGPGWEVVHQLDLYQMTCANPPASAPDSDIISLDDRHREAMLDLTALVYPAYFRPRTADLGPYYGIFDQGQLVSMAGIRGQMPGFQEISAVCTHPDYRGRGLARRLCQHVIQSVQSMGEICYLHTEFDNLKAQDMYRKLGFEIRTVLPFWILNRS